MAQELPTTTALRMCSYYQWQSERTAQTNIPKNSATATTLRGSPRQAAHPCLSNTQTSFWCYLLHCIQSALHQARNKHSRSALPRLLGGSKRERQGKSRLACAPSDGQENSYESPAMTQTVHPSYTSRWKSSPTHTGTVTVDMADLSKCRTAQHMGDCFDCFFPATVSRLSSAVFFFRITHAHVTNTTLVHTFCACREAASSPECLKQATPVLCKHLLHQLRWWACKKNRPRRRKYPHCQHCCRGKREFSWLKKIYSDIATLWMSLLFCLHDPFKKKSTKLAFGTARNHT